MSSSETPVFGYFNTMKGFSVVHSFSFTYLLPFPQSYMRISEDSLQLISLAQIVLASERSFIIKHSDNYKHLCVLVVKYFKILCLFYTHH